MKGHIGVDSRSKLIYSVVATAANVHDSQVLGKLLHGGETQVWGDRLIGDKQTHSGVRARCEGFHPPAGDAATAR